MTRLHNPLATPWTLLQTIPTTVITDVVKPARDAGKATGEASAIPFTPVSLIEEISSKIPDVANRCFNTKIAVLYTVEWALWLLSKGFKDITVITRTYDPGVEKVVNFFAAQSGVKGFVYMTEEKAKKMKFDVVVGNPPYQSVTEGADPNSERVSGKRNLYDKFLFLADELAPTWAMIVPSFWLGRQTHKLHTTLLKKCSCAINTTQHFPSVVGVNTCALIKPINRPPDIEMCDGPVITRWPHAEVMGFLDNDLVHILNKVKSNYVGMDTIHFQSNQYIRSKIKQGGSYACVDITGPANVASPSYVFSKDPLPQQHVGKPRVVLNWNGSPTGIGAVKVIDISNASISASCVALVCASTIEATNLVLLLNTKLYQFIVKVVKTSATNNKATFQHLPLLDLTRSWTDQELYQHFNLTQDEIDLIERTVK